MKTTIEIPIKRISNGKIIPQETSDSIAIEQQINIKLTDKTFNLLCSPKNFPELITGFLFTQSIINTATDILEINQNKNEFVVSIVKQQPNKTYHKANPKPIKNPKILFSMMQQLHAKQKIFKLTGCAHAAAIFDINGNMLAFQEDVARHNALDKAIGECLIKNYALTNCIVALSSRVNYELINKIATANLSTVIAVSAPTSLAIKLAKEKNIMLYGFVRNNNANIYT